MTVNEEIRRDGCRELLALSSRKVELVKAIKIKDLECFAGCQTGW